MFIPRFRSANEGRLLNIWLFIDFYTMKIDCDFEAGPQSLGYKNI